MNKLNEVVIVFDCGSTNVAVIVAFVGIGLYKNEDEAKKEINYGITTFEPSKQSSVYEDIYNKYKEIPQSLKPFYSKI